MKVVNMSEKVCGGAVVGKKENLKYLKYLKKVKIINKREITKLYKDKFWTMKRSWDPSTNTKKNVVYL